MSGISGVTACYVTMGIISVGGVEVSGVKVGGHRVVLHKAQAMCLEYVKYNCLDVYWLVGHFCQCFIIYLTVFVPFSLSPRYLRVVTWHCTA